MFLNKFVLETEFQFGVDSTFDAAETRAPVRAMAAGNPLDNRGDVDGDGYNDILMNKVIDFSDFLGGGTPPTHYAIGYFDMPSASWNHIGSVAFGWIVTGTGDFDNDGSHDLILYNFISGATGRFDMENGSNAGWEGLGSSSWVPLTHADMNGDGITDEPYALAADFDDNEIGVSKIGYFQKDAQGGKTWKGLVTYSEEWINPTLADFNADGIWDMMMVNEQTGVIGQFRLGGGNAVWSKITTMGSGYESLESGDLNGDGYHDIIAYNTDTNRIGYYDMAGGTPSWVGLGSYGSGWEVEMVTDYTNDGRADIIWTNSNTGAIGMWEVDGASKSWSSVAFAGADWELTI